MYVHVYVFVSCPIQGVVSRELVQLEDLLKWSERGLAEGGGNSDTDDIIAEALLVREEANKVVQVNKKTRGKMTADE